MIAMSPGTLTMAADHASVRSLEPWLDQLLDQLDRTEAAWLQPRLLLAAHEVCINIVDHAYHGAGGDLWVDGWVEDDHVQLRICDRGQPFDAATASTRRTDLTGEPRCYGYGLTIVERLVDELRYERAGGLSRWWLRMSRPPDRQTR
jgi:serine/threonine-protein kinase RsbW